MAGTDAQRRRFVTRAHVEDAAATGQALRLGPRDVLTDEAGTRARDLGVAIERDGAPAGAPGRRPTQAPAASGAATSQGEDALRVAVRAAVVAELGAGTPGIDAAIDRVFARRASR